MGVKELQPTLQLGNGSAQYKRPTEMRTQWLRKAVNVLSQSILRAVSVGGLHGPPYVILLPPHTSWQKKKTKENHWGGLWYHLPSFWVNPEEEEIRINYRALKKLSVFMIIPSGNSDNCTINGAITTEDLPCLLKPAMLCVGS